MCGQVGIIFGRKRRRPDERDYLREVFIRMLLHSEERGPHASGLAWLKTDGSHRIFKRPMRAHELVYEKPFQELLGQVDNETTILMGHTRWRTRGNEFNNQRSRIPRTGRIVLSGREMGRLYHAKGVERLIRNDLWKGRTPERFYDAIEWLYGWNVTNCLARD